MFVPRHRIGVAGVVFNASGDVLLVEHVMRRRIRWGLPGGWVGRGEDPAEALKRELREELQLEIAVERVLLCEGTRQKIVPFSIAVAFRCGALGEPGRLDRREVTSFRWVKPDAIDVELLDFHHRAIAVARDQRLES